MTTECEHAWEPLSEDEVTEIRRQTRRGRPNMAWVEGVSRCSSCGQREASVSWYGQFHKVPVVEETPGDISIRWPSRQNTGGGGGAGMG